MKMYNFILLINCYSVGTEARAGGGWVGGGGDEREEEVDRQRLRGTEIERWKEEREREGRKRETVS